MIVIGRQANRQTHRQTLQTWLTIPKVPGSGSISNYICQNAILPKLYVMVKWLPNQSSNAYFLNFFNWNLSHFDVQMCSNGIQTNLFFLMNLANLIFWNLMWQISICFTYLFIPRTRKSMSIEKNGNSSSRNSLIIKENEKVSPAIWLSWTSSIKWDFHKLH